MIGICSRVLCSNLEQDAQLTCSSGHRHDPSYEVERRRRRDRTYNLSIFDKPPTDVTFDDVTNADDAALIRRYDRVMAEPLTLDIPHKLGKIAARDRLDRGIGKIGSLIPGGGEVRHHWDGDTMRFTVTALGQTLTCLATVFEDKVHAVVDLPPMLAMFGGRISDSLKRELPKLLT
jgi:hypothetical protein